jgi:hypothetical protein
MKSFGQYLREEINKGIEAGLSQYSAAAKLMRHLTKGTQPNLEQTIQSHFQNRSNTEYNQSGMTVRRYTSPDIGKDLHDIHVGPEHEKLQGGIEVVSGGGKMFFSKRSHKSEGLSGLQNIPALKGMEFEPQANTKISDPTGFRRVGRSVARNIETKQHSAMSELEKSMKAKHWLIGDHVIPVGNLSHFVSSSFMTQGQPSAPRLAVRVGGIVNPEQPGTKSVGSEKNWHKKLNDMLHSFDDKQLDKYGVTRIAKRKEDTV